MKVNLDTCIVRSDEPITADAGSELIMLSVAQGRYYGFNEIAAAIWRRIEEPTTVGALCGRLQREFDVSAAQCEGDVIELLQTLQEKGLLRVVAR